MNLIDTHAHLTHPDLSGNISKILDLAKEAGVEKIITCGTNLQDSQLCCELAVQHEMVYTAVGVHPTEIENPETDFRFELTELAKNPKVVAIGEIGLDYYWEKNEAKREVQKKILRAQLGAAVQLDLPVIIHNRDADEVIFDELEHYKDSERLRGVMHCFLGDESDFLSLKKLNFMLYSLYHYSPLTALIHLTFLLSKIITLSFSSTSSSIKLSFLPIPLFFINNASL